MARIAESELERLKAEVSVARLIEEAGIKLERRGHDLVGRCPFHEDSTPSLAVTPDKNLFHCFGCGAAGGPIDWTMKKNGVSFRHAVELLREGLGSIADGAVKRTTVRALPPPVSFDADDQALLDQVIGYYRETLKQSPEALAYLAARGLAHPDLIDRFKLGYANRTLGLRLPAKTRKDGADIRARLERIGIYRASGHEHFNGSLVVPVLDADDHATEVYGRKILDNLRPGTPKHLYLPGPHKGVWNIAGIAGSGGEIILTEALIDAMTFWCAGYRNVTAAYGVEGFTADHLAAFKTHNVVRALLAFDRDEAGERGAAKIGALLMAEGIACYRVPFPKGMDANEYALKVTPASKSLGVLIRKAEWLGNGNAPSAPTTTISDATDFVPPVAPISVEIADEVLPLPSAASSVQPVALAAEGNAPVADDALPASVLPAAVPAEPEAEVSGADITIRCGERRYRVRGAAKNLAVDVMKVNLLASVHRDGSVGGEDFHVDTFDLYSARARTNFIQMAAGELRLKPEIVKADLGRVLLKLEAMQETRIHEALQPEPGPREIAVAEREAALALLKSPDLLSRILADFEACGLVGEATNKLTAYLATVSRKLAAPLAVLVQSSSAAGKSSLMDAVLAFVPEEERVRYSALTGQALFYMGATSLKHRILAICEEEGAARAVYALKLLQSDGELTIASTAKDPDTGNLVTQEYRVEGPVMIFLTTTAIDIDEELMNRCLVLSVDEGRAQTEAIHKLQRRKRTLEGLMAKAGRDELLKLHRNAQRLLRPLAVVNPYADRLSFLSDKTRTRRDHEKYLTLIDTIALLHQHQRSVKRLAASDSDGREREIEYVEVTLADIEAANRLAHEVLGRSLDELPPQTRTLLDRVVGLVAERVAASNTAAAEIRFTRRELREATGASDTQLKVHLSRLVELEYLIAHRAERGQSYVYELLYDGDGSEAPHLSGLIEPKTLAHFIYDDQRSGIKAERSAPGRGAVGLRSGGSRGGSVAANADASIASLELSTSDAKTHLLEACEPSLSYTNGASRARSSSLAASSSSAAE